MAPVAPQVALRQVHTGGPNGCGTQPHCPEAHSASVAHRSPTGRFLAWQSLWQPNAVAPDCTQKVPGGHWPPFSHPVPSGSVALHLPFFRFLQGGQGFFLQGGQGFFFFFASNLGVTPEASPRGAARTATRAWRRERAVLRDRVRASKRSLDESS